MLIFFQVTADFDLILGNYRQFCFVLTGLSSPSNTSSLVKVRIQSLMVISLSFAPLDRLPDHDEDDNDE